MTTRGWKQLIGVLVKQHCTLRKDINIPLVTFFQVSEVLPPSSLCSHLISKSYSSGLSILLQMSMSDLLSAEKKSTGTLFTCTHISFLFLLRSLKAMQFIWLVSLKCGLHLLQKKLICRTYRTKYPGIYTAYNTNFFTIVYTNPQGNTGLEGKST